jgi:hypothetical protein
MHGLRSFTMDKPEMVIVYILATYLIVILAVVYTM